MRHKWILLMCVGVILLQVTIASPVDPLNADEKHATNGDGSQSQKSSTHFNQAYSADNSVNKHIDSVTEGPTEKAQINEEEIGDNNEPKNDASSTAENSTKNQLDDDRTAEHNATLNADLNSTEKTKEPSKPNTTTTEKPPSICTKSGLNYDCILQDIQLTRNESNNFGLTWTNNSQKKITFENSRLAYLPKKLFDAFPQMELLNAEDLQMEDIEDRAFRNAANLTQLYLQNNRFSTINKFTGVPQLLHLDLSNNRIKHIDKEAFSNNNLLERMLLNNNLISELPKTNAVKNLQNLNVANNEIGRISDHQFSKNKKLANLDVSFNKLSNFNLVQLDNNPLLIIDVSHNKLESIYIPKGARVLNATNNSIQVVTVNECDVEKLDLSHNQITDVTDLQKCKDLKKIDLSHNRLQSFDLIESCPNLYNLNLAHNQLFEVNFPSIFHPLQILDLSYNYLSFGPSHNFTLMKIIKLNNNKFIDFKFGTMKQLNYILMCNNEWSCNKTKIITEKKKDSVNDANEVCQKPMSSQNGICCIEYKRPFNDRLKEILRETYIHENVNRKDQEKCKQTKPTSQGVGKLGIQTLQENVANLDSARKEILVKIDKRDRQITGILNQILKSQSDKSELNNKHENFTRIVYKLREHYGVVNEGLISTNLMLNRVLQFTQERNNLSKDLLARREKEVQETHNRFNYLTGTITAANALNDNLKNELFGLKRKEAAAKKEKQQLEKEANRNSPSLHSSKG